KLRIVGTGPPRRTSALRPGIAILRPRFRTRLAGRWNGISAPQLLSGRRIPSVQEPARGRLASRHAVNQHAIRDNRTAGRVIPIAIVREFLVPKLFAG